jgi:hypothetical protein
LPGTWTEEKSKSDAVFQGRSGNRWISITVFDFNMGLSREDRIKPVAEIQESRKTVERRLSKGEAEIEFTPPCESDGLVYSSILSTNPSMGLVSFTRLIANDENVLSVYWQVDGSNEPPPLSSLLIEFEQAMASILIA